MTQDIVTLIEAHFDSLSPGKKKVARFILRNLNESSYLTLAQLQKKTQVSEATIIRFAYTIGFAGYTEMQNYVRDYVFHTESTDKTSEVQHVNTMSKDMQLIQEISNTLNDADIATTVQYLHEAKMIYVLGNNTSYASAYWFSYVLSNYKAQVKVVDKDDMNKHLLDMQSDDVVLAISFPRYHKDTVHFFNQAKMMGARTIAITDAQVSPIYKSADITFFGKTNRDVSGYNEIAPVISLLNVIINQYRTTYHDEVKQRIQQIERLNDQSNNLVE